MDGESTIQSRIKEMNNKTLTIACSSPECSDVFPGLIAAFIVGIPLVIGAICIGVWLGNKLYNSKP